MKKSDFFIMLGRTALAIAPAVPGGAAAVAVEQGVEHLVKHDAPVGDTVVDMLMKSLAAAEGFSDKDLLDDPLVAKLAVNIKGDIELLHALMVARHTPASV
jgi:hypothetical protein